MQDSFPIKKQKFEPNFLISTQVALVCPCWLYFGFLLAIGFSIFAGNKKIKQNQNLGPNSQDVKAYRIKYSIGKCETSRLLGVMDTSIVNSTEVKTLSLSYS
jgi:hypothetical protein